MSNETETDWAAVETQAENAWATLNDWVAKSESQLAEAQRFHDEALAKREENRPLYLAVKANAAQRSAPQPVPAVAAQPYQVPAQRIDPEVDARLRNLESGVASILRALAQRPVQRPPEPEPPTAGAPVPRPTTPPVMPSPAAIPSQSE